MPENNTTQARPSLPKPLQDLVDEAGRIDSKREAAKNLGLGDNLLVNLDQAIKLLKKAIGDAAVKEAFREIEDANQQAQNVLNGVEAPAVVAPGPDQQRIAEVDKEIKRIKDKLKKAKEHGARKAHLKPIEEKMKDLDKKIRDAALGAADRELKAVLQELKDIKDGKGPPPDANGQGPGPHQQDKDKDKDKDKDGDKNGAGGSGGGGGGQLGGFRLVVGEVKPNDKLPDPNRTYVQSKRSVWAWSRRDQQWVQIEFDTDIIKVELITGGIMAIAESGAALFDSTFGRWLPRLNVQNDALTDGESD